MAEYSIFKPKSSRGIFTDYPELRKMGFSKLNNEEMLFVWYYACESSPFVNIDSDRNRVQRAIDESYHKKGDIRGISKVQESEMLGGKFTSKISAAITEMKKFKVGPRARANMIIEKGFKNMETILDIDASDASMFLNKDDEVDFSKKKAYIDSLAKASDLMPKLIDQLEGRFSLTDDKGDGDTTFDGESLLDTFHENEQH